ncbi:Angiotensin-converting enzyme [Lamellibrachia satsuma]|nr:Angiotensin-converting enzyme [Lamellibrachia satsuma]
MGRITRSLLPGLALSCLATAILLSSVIVADDGFEDFLEEVQELVSHDTDYTSETDAKTWLDDLNRALEEDINKVSIAGWNYETNLTKENSEKLVQAELQFQRWNSVQLIKAKTYLANSKNFVRHSDVLRQMRTYVSMFPFVSHDVSFRKALAEAKTKLEAVFNDARVIKDGKSYAIQPELTKVMSSSRDYNELLWAWRGWRDAIGPHSKPLFTEVVTRLNVVSRQNGYCDAGEAWRISNYEIDNIDSMTNILYKEIAPFYEQLHAYVRRKLIQRYPGRGIDPRGAIPAHLLGNMWAQEWDGIMDVVAPYPDVAPYNVTGVLQSYTPKQMFKMAENFFMLIGLDPMTSTFWSKSMIEKPRDRNVVCHGSAEDFFQEGDYRIKMCTVRTAESLKTIHHEMGHIQYFMQYSHQPAIYRQGANAAFHEAIGDTISLSVATPAHMRSVGLLTDKPNNDRRSEEDDNKKEINFLMKMALEKIAFLPFGYLIDRWRWEVFRGDVTPDNYNKRWWELRLRYQGIVPPVQRTEKDFDPGSKYHVSSFVPYIRYFLSFIGQFQFHQALCNAAGHGGPLHKCDIYQSKKAGNLLKSVLRLGASQPWPDAMEIITGQREFSTAAILEYFKPLHDWLKQENANEHVGWKRNN